MHHSQRLITMALNAHVHDVIIHTCIQSLVFLNNQFMTSSGTHKIYCIPSLETCSSSMWMYGYLGFFSCWAARIQSFTINWLSAITMVLTSGWFYIDFQRIKLGSWLAGNSISGSNPGWSYIMYNDYITNLYSVLICSIGNVGFP